MSKRKAGPPKGSRQSKKVHDWDELGIMWAVSGLSKKKFADAMKMSDNPHFYKMSKIHKWDDKKKRIVEAAESKMVEKLGKEVADRWDEHRCIINDATKHAEAFLKKFTDEDGKPLGHIPPSELKSVVETVFKATQALSFMSGGPTDRTESANLHLSVVKAVEDRDKKFGVQD